MILRGDNSVKNGNIVRNKLLYLYLCPYIVLTKIFEKNPSNIQWQELGGSKLPR
jgi:hypothetical protein